MTSYIGKNIKRPTKRGAGTRQPMDAFVSFVPLSIIKKWPKTDANGVKMTENLDLVAGEYVEKIDVTPSSLKILKNADGDEDHVGWLNGVEYTHPGDELELSEFEANRVNVPGVVIIGFDQKTANPYMKIVGSPDAPLMFKIEGQLDNDATKSTHKFEAVTKSASVPFFYYGTLTEQTPVDTIPADATTVDTTAGNGEYQTTSGTAAAVTIDAFSNVTEGTIITLKGSGGAYPTIIDATANILLYEGASWAANANSSITLKAFKSGANAFTMVEVSRS